MNLDGSQIMKHYLIKHEHVEFIIQVRNLRQLEIPGLLAVVLQTACAQLRSFSQISIAMGNNGKLPQY